VFLSIVRVISSHRKAGLLLLAREALIGFQGFRELRLVRIPRCHNINRGYLSFLLNALILMLTDVLMLSLICSVIHLASLYIEFQKSQSRVYTN
jgi:hypothetical protein